MRDIKFRAWYTYRNSFYVYGSEAIRMLIAKPNGSGVIIEQYTGIKDKNGVEIYENDIVKTNPMIPGDEEFTDLVKIGLVSFLEGGYCIENINGAISVFQETIILEVVGNIHENADLLEETT